MTYLHDSCVCFVLGWSPWTTGLWCSQQWLDQIIASAAAVANGLCLCLSNTPLPLHRALACSICKSNNSNASFSVHDPLQQLTNLDCVVWHTLL